MRDVPTIGTIQWTLASAAHPYPKEASWKKGRGPYHERKPMFRLGFTVLSFCLKKSVAQGTENADGQYHTNAKTEITKAGYPCAEPILGTPDAGESREKKVDQTENHGVE